MFISVTRLELRSYWSFFKFLSISKRAQKQAEQAKGNLHVGLNNLGFRFFLTLTAWDSEEDMLTFIKTGAHAEAMRRSGEIARSVQSTHFEANEVPDWEEARKKLDNSIKDR